MEKKKDYLLPGDKVTIYEGDRKVISFSLNNFGFFSFSGSDGKYRLIINLDKDITLIDEPCQ